MFYSKNHVRYIILGCTLIIFIFFIHPNQVLNKQELVELFNQAQMKQDNPNLIDLIKSYYIVEPAPLETPLNFKTKIWSSPVTMVVRSLLKNKTGGFFIECGAFDGEWLSNTIELETYLKWEGLLVEADPTYQSQLLTKNRKSWIAPVCLSPNPYPMKISMQRHKEWAAMSNIPNLFFGKTKPGEFPVQFDVQCFPLYSLLLALNRTEIDYLSLDVEGAEWSIIQTIPFDKVKIKVISLEKSRDYSKSSKYLQSLGYRFYADVRQPYVFDVVYVHKSVLSSDD